MNPARLLPPRLLVWLGFGVLAILCLVLRDDAKWLVKYPTGWILPIEAGLEYLMDWFTANFKPLFRLISDALEWPMRGIQAVLQTSPWPVTIAIVAIIAYAAKGWRLSAFCIASLLYMVVVGYWDESMSTLALVCMSVPLSVMIGFIMGLLGFQFRWARRVIEPTLDVMQTVPTFAYLIPILILFGIGPVVGMVASAIYASPPMVRNLMLGLQRVPDNVIESGQMSGCNGFQLLFMVRVPAAMHTIMIGVNQTIMAALAMVIIAAIIGGFADIGWEVLSTMRKAQTGQSLLAGLVIVLIAMMMDRISRGFAERTGEIHVRRSGNYIARHPMLVSMAAAVAAGTLLSWAVPVFSAYPEAWIIDPAERLNTAVSWFTRNFFDTTDAIKTYTLYFFMLPMKAGPREDRPAHLVGLRDDGAGLRHLLDDPGGHRLPGGTAGRLARRRRSRTPGHPLLLRFVRNAVARLHRRRHPDRLPGRRLEGCPLRLPRHGLHAGERRLAQSHAVVLSHRHLGHHLLRRRRGLRDLGGAERPRLRRSAADQRHPADDAALRLPHPRGDGVPGGRFLGAAGHHHVRHRAGDPLHRARHPPRRSRGHRGRPA